MYVCECVCMWYNKQHMDMGYLRVIIKFNDSTRYKQRFIGEHKQILSLFI